jgi:hypothetical protein
MKKLIKIAKIFIIFIIITGWIFQYPPDLFWKNFGGQGWRQFSKAPEFHFYPTKFI